MTKANMIKTLQRLESEAWERLLRYENENAPWRTATEEINWKKNDREYNELLHEWSTLNDALEECEIKRLFSETAYEYSVETYKKNKAYREKVKADVDRNLTQFS